VSKAGAFLQVTTVHALQRRPASVHSGFEDELVGKAGYPAGSWARQTGGPAFYPAGELPVFSLDPRLAQDSHHLGDLPLCRVLLSNDAQYPWFILVPRQANASELFDLDEPARQLLWAETHCLAERLSQGYAADKMNVATLGNVVAQLHMHVIVRYTTDAAWPAPVWGRHPARPYTAEELEAVRGKLAQLLGDDCHFVAVRP
jgi:diadenosine tetraphosphate (Ap4A) HIT family hydrolase